MRRIGAWQQSGVVASLAGMDTTRFLYGTPIVFCTGFGDGQTIDRIRTFGGELLLKPIHPEELAYAILRASGH